MSCKLDRLLACGKGDVRMFSVGDQVCYPMHGVGVVEKIEALLPREEQQPAE